MRKDGLVIQPKITYTADHSSFQMSVKNKEACARNILGWTEEEVLHNDAIFNTTLRAIVKSILNVYCDNC